MTSLDHVLDRLLHDAHCLQSLLRDGPDAFELSAEDRDALLTIDREQLVLAHRKVRRELLSRKQRGCDSLARAFADTLSGADHDAVAAGFAASPEHSRHRNTPFSSGMSLEEAFYRYAERVDLGRAQDRERDFLAAMCRALVMSPQPRFTVPAELERIGDSWVARTTRGEPWTFAATPKGFARGKRRQPAG